MAAVLDMTLEVQQPKLRQGAVLLDPSDSGTRPRLLLLLDHAVREGEGETKRIVSRRLQFINATPDGEMGFAGWAPHLDCQPLGAEDLARIEPLFDQDWLSEGIEVRALAHASSTLVPEHYDEVRTQRVRRADKIGNAVRQRLVHEINQLTQRALVLEEGVKAGKQPKVQPENLKRRAEELTARLHARERELAAMRHVVSEAPRVIGGALVIPAGLLAQLKQGGMPATFAANAAARARIEALAMQAVAACEEGLGHAVKDVSADKCGWDITARPPRSDQRIPDDRLIEVKGRAKGADVITVTRNEIMTALNKPEQFVLAIVLVGEDDSIDGPYYLNRPFDTEPGWAVTSVNLDLDALLSRATHMAQGE